MYNAIVFRVTTTLVATCSVNPRYRLVPRMMHARPNNPSVGQAIRGVLRSNVSSVMRFSIAHSPYRSPRCLGIGALRQEPGEAPVASYSVSCRTSSFWATSRPWIELIGTVLLVSCDVVHGCSVQRNRHETV